MMELFPRFWCRNDIALPLFVIFSDNSVGVRRNRKCLLTAVSCKEGNRVFLFSFFRGPSREVVVTPVSFHTEKKNVKGVFDTDHLCRFRISRVNYCDASKWLIYLFLTDILWFLSIFDATSIKITK
jgi:hypothetical protein